jgi:nanoRNase/pAp phosphatase (c-di-AMP/oligoRNAs hydrolase)
MSGSSTDLFIVMARSEPDLDGVACAFAYSEFLTAGGANSLPWYPDQADGEATFALTELPAAKFASLDSVGSADGFILVDSSDLDGIPPGIDPRKFIEVIDHRFYTDPKAHFPYAKLQIESVGAAATLITERFIGSGLPPSKESVALLYGAIHSNTLHLKGDLTTERDVAAATWLEETGRLPDLWLQRQFDHRRQEIIADFSGFLARERKRYSNPEVGCFEIAQLEFLRASAALTTEAAAIKSMVIDSPTPIALNLVDIEISKSCFITSHPIIQARVSNALDASFHDNIAEFSPALLRKQMVVAINGKP